MYIYPSFFIHAATYYASMSVYISLYISFSMGSVISAINALFLQKYHVAVFKVPIIQNYSGSPIEVWTLVVHSRPDENFQDS